ncbi:MAG: FtsX-like permease family protein [bacterium]|nr:FtsX-like permease family protein [bacterium]
MINKNVKPPFLAKWILNRFSYNRLDNVFIGDLDEDHKRIYSEKGSVPAYTWYWMQTLNSLPDLIKHSFAKGIMMFKSYLKISIRNIRKQKVFSIINISGFAIAMSFSILTILVMQDFYSVDRFHENADRIFFVYSKIDYRGELSSSYGTPTPLGPTLLNDIPEIARASRFGSSGRHVIKYKDKMEYERGIRFADASIFEIFTFPLIAGDPGNALSDPGNVVISEEITEKYFDGEDPVGKILTIDNMSTVTVTGVMKNIPGNSTIEFDILLPFSSPLNGRTNDWNTFNCSTYLLLRDGASFQGIMNRFPEWKQNYPVENGDFFLQPFTDIFMHGIEGSVGQGVDLIIFVNISIVLLLTGCVNFINLSTARSGTRALEIGLRKVVGGKRNDIIKQYLGESVITALIAAVLAILMVHLMLPYYNQMSHFRPLSFNIITNIPVVLGCIGLAVAVGLISGSYPAFVLSSFQPVNALRGGSISGSRRQLLRKGLVILQFTLSLIFILVTSFVIKQEKFEQNMDRGYSLDNVITLRTMGDIGRRYETFRDDMLKNPDIESVSIGTGAPIGGSPAERENIDWQGKDPNVAFWMYRLGIDYNYTDFFQLEILEGRTFSKEYALDNSNYILNETAIQRMNMESPVGKQFSLFGRSGTIIGVVKDFNFHPLFAEMQPMILRIEPPERSHWVFVKVAENNSGIQNVKDFLEKEWKKYAPQYPFEYEFLVDRVNREYNTDDMVMMGSLSVFVIIIACLGLFALASHLTELQTKEIAVRKVFGAIIPNIMRHVIWGYLKSILIAVVIGCIAGWIIMEIGNSSMPYHADVSWSVYVISSLSLVMVAIITISFHVIKAANANPSDSLRHE